MTPLRNSMRDLQDEMLNLQDSVEFSIYNKVLIMIRPLILMDFLDLAKMDGTFESTLNQETQR